MQIAQFIIDLFVVYFGSQSRLVITPHVTLFLITFDYYAPVTYSVFVLRRHILAVDARHGLLRGDGECCVVWLWAVDGLPVPVHQLLHPDIQEAVDEEQEAFGQRKRCRKRERERCSVSRLPCVYPILAPDQIFGFLIVTNRIKQ